MQRFFPIHSLLVGCAIAACGGGEPASTEPPTGEPAATGDEQAAADAADSEAADEGEQEADAAESDGPSLPEAEPIEATDADAVREALVAASRDAEAFVRIVDPDKGIGGWDREEDMRAHFCDRARFADETTLGYELREGDEWSCNDELTRCSSVDPDDRIGTVFHFHEAGGDGRWLASIIRYHRRVPRGDPESVANWVTAAEGVCELWRTLDGEPDDIAPEKLTVFVSRFTGEVEESSTDFHCGEEATNKAREQLAPLMESGSPTLCRREPLACVWMVETDVRVYAKRDAPATPVAIAKLAADLPDGPAGAQARQVEAVAQRALVRRCQ